MLAFVAPGLALITVGLGLGGCTTVAQPTADSSALVASSDSLPQSLPLTARLQIGQRVILLEQANSAEEQRIGLMHRSVMAIDRGMVFNFQPAGPAQFWMKNTLIPLDILFLYQGKIINIQAQVPPCTADPCTSYGPDNSLLVDQVLELNAGQAQILGLKVGDRLNITPLKTPL
jgi:uncharacterized protein